MFERLTERTSDGIENQYPIEKVVVRLFEKSLGS